MSTKQKCQPKQNIPNELSCTSNVWRRNPSVASDGWEQQKTGCFNRLIERDVVQCYSPFTAPRAATLCWCAGSEVMRRCRERFIPERDKEGGKGGSERDGEMEIREMQG